jgi:dTDP-4-amino-4,6-dideoxygalactose transaminase
MLPLVKPFISPKEELMPALEEILYSGYIAEGEAVYEFERQFGEYVQNPYCISLNSGTAALHIALIMAGVKEKSNEVISTALTAEPTNIAILLAGGTVVFADVDYKTGLLDPQSVREKITERTKAILLVHYAGMVCDMDAFNELSKEFSIPIIEDNAHALGSRHNGKPVGSNSDYTVFSFQAIKQMTTIDGGMLTLKGEGACAMARKLRWFGLDKKIPRLESNITVEGYKYHMNNVNATVGIIQLRHMPEIIARYIDNGKYYDRELKSLSGVTLVSYYPNTEPSYWLYTLKVENRDGFIRCMAEAGITASPLHLRNDRHSVFQSSSELPSLDKFYEEFVHIPCGWWITGEDREYIVDIIKKGW